MFTNYLKIAVRQLWKNRFVTGLNLAGLAVGFAIALALLIFVRQELSFDRYHKHADAIYRVGLSVNYDGITQKWANAPNITGPALKAEISDVREQVRFLKYNFGRTAFVNVGGENFAETNFYWADSTLFSVFDVPMVLGDPAAALNRPNTVVISRSIAEKYFGDDYKKALGKVIKVDNEFTLEITGIYQDFPSNTIFDGDIIGSFLSVKWAAARLYWDNASFETYLLLGPGSDPRQVETKMAVALDKAIPKDEQWFSLWLQPLTDIHLYSAGISNGYSSRTGDIRQVRILAILAFAVLLLACFNYINLATAQSGKRFREVGINKILGARKGQIARRMFLETGVLVAVALISGLLLLRLLNPFFESLSGQRLDLTQAFTGPWTLAIPLFWLAITLSAGIYPALFLSSFSPKSILQPLAQGGFGKRLFRQALVVGQFSVCTGLIVSAMIFNRQIRFIGEKNLGFQPKQVIAVTTAAAERTDQITGFVDACKALPAVVSACRAMSYPGISTAGYGMSYPGQDERKVSVAANRVGTGFEKVLGLKFLAGKTLPEKAPDDTTVQVVFNKTAVDFLGWTPEESIGKTPPNLFRYPTTIVGVVEDFHFESMHQPIGAYAFNNGRKLGGQAYVLIKVQPGNINRTMAQLESAFRQNIPGSAFEYSFLDEHFGSLYAGEKRLSSLVFVFTCLAIFISCLGLFGLAAFTAEQRTKEIGIRKVLGASVVGIVGLLSKDFLKLVLVALVLATPLAWYAMNKWLNNFAYRVHMEWWIFALAGAAAVGLAFFTVSYQSVKTALMNPVKSLRSE
ncbi:MAG: ABC transporter permease [Lewinella sp.]|nr:ABC transporter permease [Lewinella sp.]